MARNDPGHISLSQLQTLIRQRVDNAHPLPYWITAEISELKVNYSGHCYLELVEKGGENHVPKAKASAVIWRSSYPMVANYFESATGQSLGIGIKVLVKVVVVYHELYGLSLQITDIDPTYTLGDMERMRQETITRLQGDGVFDMNRELELPVIIQRLAVVSSRNAAGYQDFIQELSRSGYHFDIELFDAYMQGNEAESSMVSALDAVAGQAERYDAVVIIRGGGSQSDLGAFNSYRLCCHIAQFPVPVITGIGHDKDQSVADLVAAVALKTPTAVAVYLTEKMDAFDGALDILWTELSGRVENFLTTERQSMTEAVMALRIVTDSMVRQMSMRVERLFGELREKLTRLVQGHAGKLEMLSNRLKREPFRVSGVEDMRLSRLRTELASRTNRYLTMSRRGLNTYNDRIQSRDPERIINMGFAIVRRDGKVVLDGASLQSGDQIQIRMRRAEIVAKVNGVKQDKKNITEK